MKYLSVIVLSLLILIPLANAQTILEPGTTTFTTASIVLTGNISLQGTTQYLNIFWNASYSTGFVKDVNVTCYLNCDPETQPCSSAQKCNYLGLSGTGACTITTPSYGYYAANNVTCTFYDPQFPDIPYKPYPNRTFKPIDFEVILPSHIDATIGREITPQINMRNKGLLVDNYSVHVYTLSPLLVIDPSTALVTVGPVNGISYPYQGEIGSSYVKMTLLAASSSPIVVFVEVNSTTKSDIFWTGSVEVLSKLSSLPDFSWSGIVQIIAIAAIVLFLFSKKSKSRT
jgi:hypothetical protein